MYTANIKRKQIDLENKKVFIDVEYQKDNIRISSEQFTFALDITIEQIKQRINSELKRFIAIDTSLSTLNVGVIDLSNLPTGELTPAEIEKQAWFRNFYRLEALTKLNTLGALRPALATELDTLRASVATDFKKAYIADM